MKTITAKSEVSTNPNGVKVIKSRQNKNNNSYRCMNSNKNIP